LYWNENWLLALRTFRSEGGCNRMENVA
jgi:hypothetical protein